MKFSKATNYALHTMLFLVKAETDKPIGVQQLAESQDVSPTYLSKILTKLVKARLIDSISGAQGGYKLSRNRDDINFLDIIHAIEGTASLFECDFHHSDGCLIQAEIKNAEEKMNEHLRKTKLIDLVKKEQQRLS
ncbi:cysteine metabolism repressor [Oceanobacillus picturae]|uniref:Cysteine metabolism repressor n=1 Tax=Oceanobacillus picturae TaxID=171693 RepID=A0A0U9I1V0_9BACI|nr:Rrf2 family transcriptional regulator [Oceanobacillus picturae]GAQ19597.1 cysteine metabolism repressor [Oceanobacillus picturae]